MSYFCVFQVSGSKETMASLSILSCVEKVENFFFEYATGFKSSSWTVVFDWKLWSVELSRILFWPPVLEVTG